MLGATRIHLIYYYIGALVSFGLKLRSMKKIICLALAVVLSGCSGSGTDTQESQAEVNVKTCENGVNYGGVKICTPAIEGMTECSANPVIAKLFNTNGVEGNQVLAIYINNETYKNIDSLRGINMDDFCQVYANQQFADFIADEAELGKMSDLVEGNFMKENWETIKETLKQHKNRLPSDAPTLVEKRRPDARAISFVLLTKNPADGGKSLVTFILNLVVAKARIVSIAYYKNYNGEESLQTAKAKNDSIVMRILNENR